MPSSARAASGRARGPASRTRAAAYLLRFPLAAKLAGANALLLLAAIVALWMVRQPTTGPWRAMVIAGLALAGGVVLDLALVSLALRPLRDLEGTAQRVWRGNFDARVPDSPIADRALTRLGRTLNLLLDGLVSDRARMRALAADVIRAGDRERAALARELHDSTAQSLAALSYRLVAAERTSHDAALVAELASIREAANGILEEVRLISHTVYPRILDDLGLVSGLRYLVRTMAAHGGAPIELELPEATDAAVTAIPADVGSVLYRVAQEALGNALRHARAAHVTLRLDASAEELRLQVRDDGIGFDLEEAARARPGMGLFTMRERVNLVRGRFDILTKAGAGTTISASVPVDGRPGIVTPGDRAEPGQ